jgi:hypothetical protein
MDEIGMDTYTFTSQDPLQLTHGDFLTHLSLSVLTRSRKGGGAVGCDLHGEDAIAVETAQFLWRGCGRNDGAVIEHELSLLRRRHLLEAPVA